MLLLVARLVMLLSQNFIPFPIDLVSSDRGQGNRIDIILPKSPFWLGRTPKKLNCNVNMQSNHDKQLANATIGVEEMTNDSLTNMKIQ